MNEATASATEMLLYEGAILLGMGLMFVLLFRRLGLGAVLGYLVAGALVGPHGLGLVGGGESKLAIAELGIAFLLFLVGLELNPRRLWDMRRDIFGLGLTQVVVAGLSLTAFVLFTMGFTLEAALALGLPLALSSTAQVLPSLKSTGRINSPFGERAFSVLLFQDLSIVPMITLVAAMSRAPADPGAPPGWLMGVYTVAAVAGLVLLGRFVLNPLLRLVGRLGERELFVIVGLLTVLNAAALMHSLHLSTALGAFVAGVMLADSPYRHEIEADVEPFRLILLGLFFLAVGMVLDLETVFAKPWLIAGLAIGLIVIKVITITGVAMLFKVERKAALGLGLLLSQGGEFGFVLFTQAQAALLIKPEAASLFSAVVTLSMVATPFLMLFARRLELSSPDDGAGLDDPGQAARGKAIIIGHGRFGQTVAQMLNAVGCSVTLIDKKPRQIEVSGLFDNKVYFGDGLRIDLLRLAGGEEAKLIIFCIDDPDVTAHAMGQIIAAFPNAQVFMRVFDRRQLIALHDVGLAGSVREVLESAVSMGLMSLKALGVDDDEILDVEQAFRHLDETRLAAQIDQGDITAASGMRFMPGKGGQLAKVMTVLRGDVVER